MKIRIVVYRNKRQFSPTIENPYYVYGHKSLKENKVFYIGRGKGRRALCEKSRNNFWRGYSKKGYMVVLLAENLTSNQANFCEKALIKQFGRIHNGGSLVNLTDGGDGLCGYKATKETLLKRSNAIKGKILKKVDREKLAIDYLSGLTQRQVCKKHGICPGTFAKRIPPEARAAGVKNNRKIYGNKKFGKPFIPAKGLYSGINNPFYGKKHSEETKRLMSLKKKRNYASKSDSKSFIS